MSQSVHTRETRSLFFLAFVFIVCEVAFKPHRLTFAAGGRVVFSCSDGKRWKNGFDRFIKQ